MSEIDAIRERIEEAKLCNFRTLDAKSIFVDTDWLLSEVTRLQDKIKKQSEIILQTEEMEEEAQAEVTRLQARIKELEEGIDFIYKVLDQKWVWERSEMECVILTKLYNLLEKEKG